MFQKEEEEAEEEEERVFLQDELKAHRWGTPASFIFSTIFNYRAIFHDLRDPKKVKEKKRREK